MFGRSNKYDDRPISEQHSVSPQGTKSVCMKSNHKDTSYRTQTYLFAKSCGNNIHNSYTDFATTNKPLSMSSSEVPVTKSELPTDGLMLLPNSPYVPLNLARELRGKPNEKNNCSRALHQPGLFEKPQEEGHVCIKCKATFENKRDLGQHIYDAHLKTIYPFNNRSSETQRLTSHNYYHADGESEKLSDELMKLFLE